MSSNKRQIVDDDYECYTKKYKYSENIIETNIFIKNNLHKYNDDLKKLNKIYDDYFGLDNYYF